jgi:hypothetical protein
MKDLLLSACKTVYDPVQNIMMMRERRDSSLDQASLHRAEAIDAKIDCDDASDDFVKNELHSDILSSFEHQAVLRVNRQGSRPDAPGL